VLIGHVADLHNLTAWVCRLRLQAAVTLLLLPMMLREPGKPPPLMLPAPAGWRWLPTATAQKPMTQVLRRQTLSTSRVMVNGLGSTCMNCL